MIASVICIHSSKGGTGKSTITTILASFLTYELNKSVLVIDADAPQFSIEGLRHREQSTYDSICLKCHLFDEVQKMLFASQLSAIDRPIYERYRANLLRGVQSFYPIHSIDPSKLNDAYLANCIELYDYIFLDLGGRFDENTIRTLRMANLILVPFTTQNIDVMTSLEYCLNLADLSKAGHFPQSTQFFCFWNKYKFLFNKKAAFIESQLLIKFSERGVPFEFLKSRLNDADSGFDRTKMWTTISSPILFKGGQYLNGIAHFAEEIIELLSYKNI